MLAVRAFDALLRERGVPYHAERPLGPYTTMKVGGPAEFLVEPRTPEDLAAVFSAAREVDLPVRFLGSGANLLVGDAGARGAVIHLRHFGRRDGLHVGAGYSLPRLCKETASEGLAGLEILAGIPATVGGAIRMNAGGKHGDIASSVRYVDVMTPAGEIRRMSKDQVGFRYRRTSLDGAIVIAAGFELRPADGVRARYDAVMDEKRKAQPLGTHNAGCMFKNPPGGQAGRMIDECGLKGERVGGAHVSRKHANFIVNDGSATASDVLALVDRIRSRVPAPLELEVEVW